MTRDKSRSGEVCGNLPPELAIRLGQSRQCKVCRADPMKRRNTEGGKERGREGWV